MSRFEFGWHSWEQCKGVVTLRIGPWYKWESTLVQMGIVTNGDGTMGADTDSLDAMIDTEFLKFDPDISEFLEFDPNISEVIKVDPDISEVMKFDPDISQVMMGVLPVTTSTLVQMGMVTFMISKLVQMGIGTNGHGTMGMDASTVRRGCPVNNSMGAECSVGNCLNLISTVLDLKSFGAIGSLAVDMDRLHRWEPWQLRRLLYKWDWYKWGRHNGCGYGSGGSNCPGGWCGCALTLSNRLGRRPGGRKCWRAYMGVFPPIPEVSGMISTVALTWMPASARGDLHEQAFG